MLKNSMFNFLFQQLKIAVIIALAITIVLFLTLKGEICFAYFVGFLMGCINFVLLSLGSDIILNVRPRGASVINSLFFALRYLIIVLVTIKFVTLNHGNIFALVGGLITMHVAILVSAIRRRNLLTGKEG